MKTVTYESSTGTLYHYVDDGESVDDLTIYNKIWHNDDGPAVLSDQGWAYFVDGSLHRIDGPALCNRSSSFIIHHGHNHQWVIDGIWINDRLIPWCEERDINWVSPSPEDLSLIQMKWIHV